MTKQVVLHDRGLFGGIPKRAGLGIVKTDEATSLSHAFRAIRGFAQGGQLHTLFLVCHGYTGNPMVGVSLDRGGFGLALGREKLFHKNVAAWSAIRNQARNIVVYACAAADTQPGNEGTRGDGEYLMGALAIHTNATVYAADRIQWYDTYRDLSRGVIYYHGWSGNLLCFPPTGAPAKPIRRPPLELCEALHTTCY